MAVESDDVGRLMDDVEGRIRSIVAEFLGVDPDDVTHDADLDENLGGSSLDKLDILMAVEAEFDVEIPEERADSLVTFGDVVALVAQRSVAAV